MSIARTLALILPLLAAGAGPVEVRLPLDDGRELNLPALVHALARATGRPERPRGEPVLLPMAGLAAPLTRDLLKDGLGPGTTVEVNPTDLVVRVDRSVLEPSALAAWDRRLDELDARAKLEAHRRSRYGLKARGSYRPNDPFRPTICLIHGLNSTSGVFVHMFAPLEALGYGVVVYDFPYNRRMGESGDAFRRDWAAFRRAKGESRPWSIVTHSMGGLLARSYVEGSSYAGDVSALLLIAPPHGGSSLAGAQTLLQLLQGTKAVRAREAGRSEALARLSDGLGEAAADLTPGSPYLKSLDAAGRREGVAYSILAGDVGLLSAQGRAQIEAQVRGLAGTGGLASLLARRALAELSQALDELSDGKGDGCVAVARTHLPGVADHITMHANHVELIRAPLFHPDPGPVACMPFLRQRLPKPGPAEPPAPR
ncbi:alpha/beta fold hydrolase [Isosphaeraceae bacterium EP7]